ncbi:hypothetical protein B0T11DRAFT_270819 [Plectosphaerella cucumerina]|uniref:DUF1993 domain-containing protein n=1 Tax=Plectosphaerella cucumerina TaxID=40658 RepID=A0A8K0TSK3_9PEZI|nr:hypothetical protein B0T11DRAFT_270819 [Plectosphaerella cucumerina]
MSQPSLYDFVVPTIKNGLKTFDHILNRAERDAVEKGIDANSVYPEARLIDDQKPLTFQVQNATQTVKLTVSRLTGIELEPWENNEKTFADLHKRIHDALELLDTVDPAVVATRVDTIVELPLGGNVTSVTVQQAVLGHSVPNFFFHLNTAYSILRAKGVPLGKADYISSFLGL